MTKITPIVIAGLLFSVIFSTSCTTTVEMPDSPVEIAVHRIEKGAVYTMELESAPFPHPERAEGYSFEGKFYPFSPHYNRSTVVIFVPKGFEPKRKVDLVFYFHGMFSSVERAPVDFNLYNQFTDSRVNAILILPEAAWNAPDAFGGKLEDPGNFKALVGDVMGVLLQKEIVPGGSLGSIIIAGHSGAWRIISKILENRDYAFHVKEVYLFDSLFAGLDTYAKWISKWGKRFIAVYTENGMTQYNTFLLIEKLLWKNLLPGIVADDPEEDKMLDRRRILFLRSPYDHYGVLFGNDQFRRLLESSRLRKTEGQGAS